MIKLHWFLTKVAVRSCIYAQAFLNDIDLLKRFLSNNAKYFHTFSGEKWRSFANSLHSMLILHSTVHEVAWQFNNLLAKPLDPPMILAAPTRKRSRSRQSTKDRVEWLHFRLPLSLFSVKPAQPTKIAVEHEVFRVILWLLSPLPSTEEKWEYWRYVWSWTCLRQAVGWQWH